MQNKNTRNILGFKLKNELQEIYFTEFIRYLGLSLIELFIPIYIFQNHHWGLKAVFLYYTFYRFNSIILSLFAGELAAKKGFRSSMAIGLLMHIPAYLLLYYLDQNMNLLWPLAIINGIRIVFWYIPTNSDISFQLATSKKGGSKVAILKLLYTIIAIISPVTGGYIINHFGYQNLFIIAIFFALISFFLSFLLGEQFYKYNFPSIKIFKKTIKELFNSSFTKINYLHGLKTTISAIVWPLLLFFLIGNLESIGWITTLTIILMTFFSFRISNKIDKNPQKSNTYIRNGVIFEGLAWLASSGVLEPFSIISTNIIRRTCHEYIEGPWMKIGFGKRNEYKNTLENIVSREISINIGGLIGCLIFLILSIFFSDLACLRIGIVFIGIISLLIGFNLKEVR